MDNNSKKYKNAKKRVKEEKEFYTHLTVYIIVNTVLFFLLLFLHIGIFQNGLKDLEIPKWYMFTTPFSWGIGLFFHWLKVFKNNFKFFKDWEDRKIKEFMDREEEEYKKVNR